MTESTDMLLPLQAQPAPAPKRYAVFSEDGSPSAFYLEGLHDPDAIPAGAVVVSEADWRILVAGGRMVDGKVVPPLLG